MTNAIEYKFYSIENYLSKLSTITQKIVVVYNIDAINYKYKCFWDDDLFKV